MKRERIAVLIAEDHEIVLKGLKALLDLEEDIKVVGQAESGPDTVSLCKKLNPNVVIMDIALPKLNGLDAAKLIKRTNPNTKILILSAHSDDEYISKALSLGISGYLLKQCSPQFLIQAIHEVASGRSFFSPKIAEKMTATKKSKNKSTITIEKPIAPLSSRENQVLKLIAEGKTNKQMASDLSISVKTIEKHRQNLKNKLRIHDTAGLTRYAINEGIIVSL